MQWFCIVRCAVRLNAAIFIVAFFAVVVHPVGRALRSKYVCAVHHALELFAWQLGSFCAKQHYRRICLFCTAFSKAVQPYNKCFCILSWFIECIIIIGSICCLKWINRKVICTCSLCRRYCIDSQCRYRFACRCKCCTICELDCQIIRIRPCICVSYYII